MKNPMQKLRRFFVRSRTFNAAAARSAAHAPADDDDGGHRLSGAFIIVLVLHVIAVVGVFAFARIKENRTANTPPPKPTQAAPKAAPAKTAGAKPAAAAASAATTTYSAPQHDAPKPAAPAHNVHVVKDGETLTKIAAAYSVNVPDLVSTNKLKNQDDIHKGQSLTIPSAKAAQKSPTPADTKPAQTTAQKPAPAVTERKTAKTYTVKKGDSPMKIAREHGCSYEELMKLNSIKDPKKIQTGQVLKLPVKNG